MQPTLCSRCKKNVAVVFISKMEGDKTTNEGLCLKCAKELGLPQVDDMMKRMGISDEDLALYLDYRKKAVPLMSYMESLSGWWDGGYRDKFWNTIVVDKKKPAEAVASMKSVLESCISRTTS